MQKYLKMRFSKLIFFGATGFADLIGWNRSVNSYVINRTSERLHEKLASDSVINALTEHFQKRNTIIKTGRARYRNFKKYWSRKLEWKNKIFENFVFFVASIGQYDIGDRIMFVTLWWWPYEDAGNTMMTIDFRHIIWPIWKISHQHHKNVTNINFSHHP